MLSAGNGDTLPAGGAVIERHMLVGGGGENNKTSPLPLGAVYHRLLRTRLGAV